MTKTVNLTNAAAMANLLVRVYWRKGCYRHCVRLWLKLRALELLCWTLKVAQGFVGDKP